MSILNFVTNDPGGSVKLEASVQRQQDQELDDKTPQWMRYLPTGHTAAAAETSASKKANTNTKQSKAVKSTRITSALKGAGSSNTTTATTRRLRASSYAASALPVSNNRRTSSRLNSGKYLRSTSTSTSAANSGSDSGSGSSGSRRRGGNTDEVSMLFQFAKL